VRNIKGITITTNPFQEMKEVGVLLSFEFPSTIVLSDKENQPLILEWVDCNDSGSINRYLLYKTNSSTLFSFIQGKTSHLDLISKAESGSIIVFDGAIGKEANIKVLSPSNLPYDYLPEREFYFEQSEGVHTAEVIKYFDLSNTVDLSLDSKKELSALAQENRSEIINIHLFEGKKVGHGTANTKVLGDVLINFDNLYRETGLDYFKGTGRGNKKEFVSKEEQILNSKISTEVIVNKAASFSIFIRPTVSQQLLFEQTTESEIISQNLFDLFALSEDLKELTNSFNKYSSHVYKSYIEFLSNIKELNIKIDYKFHSPFNNKDFTSCFNAERAWKILENLNNLEIVDTAKFECLVLFRALNINTRYFTAISNEGETYNGYFDILLKEGLSQLNFTDFYDITIERKIIKDADRNDPKIVDTITSCIPRPKT
jgi:hypothetical protein